MKRMLIAELCAVAFLVLAVVGIVVPSCLRRTRAKQDLGDAAHEIKAAPSTLIKQLGDPTTRLEAALALGRLKSAEAAEFLPYCLTDPDPEVRRACVWALGEIADQTTSQHIRWRLGDQDLSVRLAAAEALANVPDAEGIKELVALLRDAAPEMREAAKKALLAIGAPALGDLDAAVEAAGMDVRPVLVELVAAIGGPHSVPTLVKLLGTADPVRRDRRDTKVDEAVRQAATAALAKLGAPAAEALGRQLTSPRCSFEHRKTLAEAFKLLGKPAIEPVARHVLAWRVFPREEEPRLWAGVLEDIGKGDVQAEAALQRAREQLAAGDGGTGVPPVTANLAELRILDVPDLTPCSPVELPPVPKELPANGQVKLLLHNALIGGKRSRDLPDHTLELNLLRHRGQWQKDFWGKSITYNQGDHEGAVLKCQETGKVALSIQVAIADDNWVQGGFGKYEVEFAKAEQGYAGSHTGWFNGHEVKGDVTVQLQEWPESAFAPWSVETGEHPRLLFRKGQLPKMRQRAQTELGRAIFKALRAKIIEDEQTVDHAIGWALLGLLLDDPAYSRQAIPVLRHGMKTFTIGHQHDSARKMLPVCLAYDLAYPAMSEAEVKEFNDYVVKEGHALGRFGLGNNCLSANSNWCAISFGPAVMVTLAGLREEGPFDLAPPKEQLPATVVASDPAPPPAEGVPVREFKEGELLRDWLVAGPFEVRGAEPPRLPDAPQEGAAVEWQGKTLKFARLPESAIHKAPPFLKLPGVIRFAEAPAGSRFYLYGLLKIANEQGVQIHIPVGDNASASPLINGRRFGDGDVVALQPGTHRLLLEVAGPAVSPFLTAADHRQRLGLWERYQWEKRRWDALKVQHAKTGEAPQMPLGLTTSSRYVNLWFTHAIGEHAWKTEPEGYTMISLDMVLPAASAYPTVTGRPLVCGSGLPWVMPLQLMRVCASGGGGYSGTDAPFSVRHLCYATHLSRPELQPALVWEFNRRLLPDKLNSLSCQELAFVLAFFPFDVKPRPPEEVMPEVMAERRKGAFLFRNAFKDADDIVATMFYRAERPYGGTYFHPQAGSFRISGLGTAWVNGIVGDKRNWDYADECVLHIEGSNGDGLGKVLYFESKPDGSGVIGADMADVYNRNTKLGVKAERHFAVDYSGASSAPALFAVVDRVKGGGKKTWRLHTEGRSISVNGRSFAIEGRVGGTLSAITEAREADFLVVMTIQRSAAPSMQVEGGDLSAAVTVGGQTVRFSDGKLLVVPK